MTKQRERLVDLDQQSPKPIAGRRSQRLQDRREALRKIGGGLIASLGGGALLTHGQAAHAQAPEHQAYQTNGLSLAYASWIHGHTAHVELPNRVRRLTPYGFHLEIDGVPYSGLNWVHFGIPTPVILQGNRLRITRVMLIFSTTGSDSWVSNVHVWDGPYRIANFDGLRLYGDHPFEVFDIPGTPSIGFGIGVSVGIDPGVHLFRFSTVGGDFVL